MLEAEFGDDPLDTPFGKTFEIYQFNQQRISIVYNNIFSVATIFRLVIFAETPWFQRFTDERAVISEIIYFPPQNSNIK